MKFVKTESGSDLNLASIEAGESLKEIKAQSAGVGTAFRRVIWLERPLESRDRTDAGVIEIAADGIADSDTQRRKRLLR